MFPTILNPKLKTDRQAFTLVEMLVVFGIVGLLTALLMAALPNVIDAKNRTICSANLRQIGALVANSAAENQGRLPESGKNGLFSFVGEIMPELTVANVSHPLFHCPADKTGGKNSYSIPEGSATAPAAYVRRTRSPGDSSSAYLVGLYPMAAFPHPSTTFLMVEVPSNKRTYLFSGNASIASQQVQFQNGGPYAHEKKGANYLFLDGHVEFIPTPLSPDGAWPSSKTEYYERWVDGFNAQ